jgi:hypothetical protein
MSNAPAPRPGTASGPRAWNAFIATDIEPAGDDAKGVAAAECLQVEVVHVGLADPVKVAGQLEQLAAHVGAERLLQLGGQRQLVERAIEAGIGTPARLTFDDHVRRRLTTQFHRVGGG